MLRRRLIPCRLDRTPVWAGDAAAGPVLFMVGDSRIAHWPLHPAPGWRFGKLGYSGETADNIARAAAPALAAAGATIVVIQAGGNDASAAAFQAGRARLETIGRAVAAVRALAAQAAAAGAHRVLVLTVVPPIRLVWWKRLLLGQRSVRTIAAINARLRDLGAGGEFEIVDADRLFRDETGRLQVAYRRDSLHWNAAAYRMLNAVIDRIVLRG